MDLSQWSREQLETSFLEMVNILEAVANKIILPEERLQFLEVIENAKKPKKEVEDLGISDGILSMLGVDSFEDDLPKEPELPFYMTVLMNSSESSYYIFDEGELGTIKLIAFNTQKTSDEFHENKIAPKLKSTVYYKTIKTQELTEFLNSTFPITKVVISFYSDIKKEPENIVLQT